MGWMIFSRRSKCLRIKMSPTHAKSLLSALFDIYRIGAVDSSLNGWQVCEVRGRAEDLSERSELYVHR